MERKQRERGSVSIEAAISLVAFTFVMVSVLLLINISRTQMRLQTAADKAVKELAGYLYLYKISGLYDVDVKIQDSSELITTTASGAMKNFDDIAGGIEKVMDQINQSAPREGSSEGTIQRLSNIAKAAEESGQTINEASAELKDTFSKIADDPITYLKSLGALATSYGIGQAKSFLLGSLLAKNLTLKYLGEKDEVDQLLRGWNVEDGVDGLDFSGSCIFEKSSGSANPQEDINIVILYKMNVAPLMGKVFKQTFCITASARGWLGGDTSIERLRDPNPHEPEAPATPASSAPQPTGSPKPTEEPQPTETPQPTEEPKKTWNATEAKEEFKEKLSQRSKYMYGDLYVTGDLEGQKDFREVLALGSAQWDNMSIRNYIAQLYQLTEGSKVINATPGAAYHLKINKENEAGMPEYVDAEINGTEIYYLTIIVPPEAAAQNPLVFGEGMVDVLEMQIKNDLAQNEAQARRILVDIQYGEA